MKKQRLVLESMKFPKPKPKPTPGGGNGSGGSNGG